MKRRHESQIDLNGRNRDDEHTKRKDSSIKSIGKIKREIRSVKRLLSRVEDLPPTVVQENERKLEMLENKLVNTKQSKVSDKYKMVRFFEKRKLFRRLKTARNAHGEDSPQVQKIRDQINYIVYYPLGEKYISLLPKEPYTDETVVSKQEEILQSIAGKVSSGELEDSSQTSWSKDKNVSLSRIKSLQAPDLSQTRRRVHSKPLPEPATSDDFFIIDQG